MPIGSFSGLNLSLRALLAQQAALDTTAHNIANVETVGYTRQQAVLGATRPVTVEAGAVQTGAGAQLGQGVDVVEYRRTRDLFGDLQLRAQTTASGSSEMTAQALSYAQDLLAEPTDAGLNAVLGSFHDAWATLGAHPDSAAAKAGVVQAGQNAAAALSSLQGGIAALRGSAASQLDQLRGPSGPVAQLSKELASIDDGIRRGTSAGQAPNDLLDRRDAILDELSGFGQVTTTDGGSGSLDVMLDGEPVVTGGASTWAPTTTPQSGRLGALASLASAGGPLGSYEASLDDVAATLASTVNGASPGFFTGTTAATLAVSAQVRASPSLVVAGPGGPGDGSTAQAIAASRTGTSGATAKYQALVARMGAEVAGAATQADVSGRLAAAADDRRQSVNGVSLDEEMINLTRFQRGYQAASRAFSTMDETLDILINRTGRVGL